MIVVPSFCVEAARLFSISQIAKQRFALKFSGVIATFPSYIKKYVMFYPATCYHKIFEKQQPVKKIRSIFLDIIDQKRPYLWS